MNLRAGKHIQYDRGFWGEIRILAVIMSRPFPLQACGSSSTAPEITSWSPNIGMDRGRSEPCALRTLAAGLSTRSSIAADRKIDECAGRAEVGGAGEGNPTGDMNDEGGALRRLPTLFTGCNFNGGRRVPELVPALDLLERSVRVDCCS